MDDLTSKFIANANKSTQKTVEIISAYTGKRISHGDELDVTRSEICLVIAVISAIGFIAYIVVGA